MLLFTSCPSPINQENPGITEPSSTNPGTTDPGSSVSIPSDWWGRWLRLDNQQNWYFGNKSVEISDVPNIPSSATSLSLAVSGKVLTWVDTRTIKVREGASVYYLSRDGGDSLSFSGSVVSNVASRGIVGGIAGIAIIVHNIRNDEDRHTVTTGADGSFTVPGAIPGSTYAVTTETSTIETQVEPANDGEDVGVVTLTDGTYSFKAIPEYPATAPFLFADGATYTATIRIRNDGTMLSPSPFYTLTEPVGMTISSIKVNNLQTIPASGERTFQVSFSVPSITEEWKDFVIGVRLEDSSGKIWADSVSFRFYRDALTLRFASSGWGNAPVVILPDARIVPATWSGFRVPFATTGYKVVMSGATMDTEMKYSIAVETATTDTSAFVSPNSYEPNNGSDAASTIGMEQAIVSYLAFNDLDYWSVDTSTPRITSSFGAADWVSNLQFEWLAVPGAGACELQISQDSTFANSVVDVDLAGSASSYVHTTVLPQTGTWYWRLRAQVAGVWGGWGSRTFSYTMSAPVSTTPSQTWDAQPVLTWSVPARISQAYEFQVSQDLSFSTVLVDADVVGSATEYDLVSSLNAEGIWYWRQRMMVDGFWGQWDTRTFDYVKISSIEALGSRTFFMTTDGTVWAMGNNGDGQLGDGTMNSRSTPVQIMAGIQTVDSSQSGMGLFSLLLKTDGTVWATGANFLGELGDGTTTSRITPVRIRP